jgi:hypothetical protein
VPELQGKAASIVSHELHQLACTLSESWELIDSADDLAFYKEELVEAVRRIRGTANQLATAMNNTATNIKPGRCAKQLEGVRLAFQEAVSRYEAHHNKRSARDSQARSLRARVKLT